LVTSYRTTVSPSPPEPSSASTPELVTYISRLELEQILGEGVRTLPHEERFEAAILFVDVAGFTPITETLAKQGPRGAELLSEILNDYYGRLTNLVDEYGGDVLFFAGDAAIVLFKDRESELRDLVRLAVGCGLEVRRALDGFEAGSAPGFSLSLRASVGAGSLRALRVGMGTRLTLVTGDAIAQIARIVSVRTTRGVVLSKLAHAELGEAAAATRVSRDACEVTRLHETERKIISRANPVVSDATVVERALPEVVVQRMRARQHAFLAEFRTLSVVFVGFEDVVAPPLAELDSTVIALARLVSHFDGAVYQFLEDDKGTTLVVAFGIPPRVHEDDAARAALFAAAAATETAALGIRTSISVATGRLFCGAYGGATRKQYSLVGPTINRAARLMQAARAHRVLCDEPTRRAAERHMKFESLGSLALKGVEEPVLVSRPLADSPRPRRGPSSRPQSVGRAEERDALRHAVDALRAGRSQEPVLLVAEAGMGKSHMMSELREIATESGVRFVKGEADSMETGTPYFAFRSVFAELLEVSELPAEVARARVLEALSDVRELAPMAPLLTMVLPLAFPETTLTQQMTPQIRAENLTRLLLHLVRRAARIAPFLLVLEDGHWFDSASWALVTLVRQLVPGATIVVTMRPMDHEPSDCAKLREGALRLALPPMNREQTVEILLHRFGVPAVPSALVDFIVARAEGNPFYVEEIAYSLRDSGRIHIDDGRLEAPSGWASLVNLAFPESLEAVITSRVARLAAHEQLVLKVASVVGRHFEDAAVRDALPVAEDRDGVVASLARLEQLDLLAKDRDASWVFRHAVTRETTYGLLSYSQRRSLHRAVAEHLERRYEADLSPVYARLAQHWSLAEDAPKAMAAYGNAGEQSLGAYANDEAITFLTNALELHSSQKAQATQRDRARWLKLVGEAHYSLGSHDKSAAAYESGLRALGFAPPSGARGATIELLRHLVHRVRERLTGSSARPAGPEERERLKSAVDIIAELQAVFLWKGEQSKFLESAFMSRNLGDTLGGEAAAAIGMAAYVLAMMGLRGLAERDLQRAIALAEANELLLTKTEVYVVFGMFLSFAGRPLEAVAPLRHAGSLADELGGGLWKHRAKFMLGEPLVMLGRYEEAARVFGEAAVHSVGAEPTVVGFSYAMQALSRLRLGDVDEALSLLEGPSGVKMVRSTTVPLQLFASLGPLAEARLEQGDAAGALEAIREAEAAAPGAQANGYFAGIHGHSAACHVYLSLAERAASGLPSPLSEREALSHARRAVARLAKFSRTYPGARASFLLMSGRLSLQSGRLRAGIRALRHAAQIANAQQLPYEEASAHLHAARYLRDEQGRAHARTAIELFTRFGMKRELLRCSAVTSVER
jgi:class 3 adenylate cyclase/tetratricopeptide (TPR) repeat protein